MGFASMSSVKAFSADVRGRVDMIRDMQCNRLQHTTGRHGMRAPCAPKSPQARKPVWETSFSKLWQFSFGQIVKCRKNTRVERLVF